MKEPKNGTTVSLFLPCDATLTVRGWRQIVIELPKVFRVPVVPPLPQSRARQDSSPRGIVWHGIREAVARTTVLTSMKSPSHVIEVANPAKPEVAQMNVLVLPDQRGKVRRFASFGNRDVAIEELIANSFMRVQWENQDKLLLPVRPVAKTKIKRRIPRTRKGRDPEALAALRAPRARNPRSLKDPGPVHLSRLLPQFVLLHPCLHPCLRHFVSLNQEYFVHRFVLMIHRTYLMLKSEGT